MSIKNVDLATDCRHEDSGTTLGFKAGVYATTHTDEPTELLEYALEKGPETRSEILIDFAEGYYEAKVAAGNSTSDIWPELPYTCDDCDFAVRCYEKLGNNYRFKA